jgi:hypothetical protein
MMRSFDYARTPPEARQGFAVFAVRLVVVIVPPLMRETRGGVNGFETKIGVNEVELEVIVTQ